MSEFVLGSGGQLVRQSRPAWQGDYGAYARGKIADRARAEAEELTERETKLKALAEEKRRLDRVKNGELSLDDAISEVNIALELAQGDVAEDVEVGSDVARPQYIGMNAVKASMSST